MQYFTWIFHKEGIPIEDALSIVELSRKRKDKRVFGVVGAAKMKIQEKKK